MAEIKIPRAPCKTKCIKCYYQHSESTCLCSIQERLCNLVCPRPVELEPSWLAFTISSRDFFNCLGGRRTHDEGNIKLARDLRRTQFTVCMEKTLHANGGHKYRCLVSNSKELHGEGSRAT